MYKFEIVVVTIMSTNTSMQTS